MSRWFFKTKEELQAAAAKRQAKKLDREIRREARYYSDLIPRVLANMGIDHWIPRADRPTLIEEKVTGIQARQRVSIIQAEYSDFAHYLWVDTRFLPYRSTLADLHTDEVLETLSDACGRQVVWKSLPGKGSHYVIWRDGAVNAIPAIFKFNEILAMIPDNAPPLFYIAGVTENNKLIKVDLAVLPHLLVAGSTFTGKSVHLNQLLCQLLLRNTPATLQLMMIDLKQGSEFSAYESLPHLVAPIITKEEQVPEALETFQELMRQRMLKFAGRGIKNLEGWNLTVKDDPLPYVVLVFDELALLMTSPNRKLAKESALILNAIMATSRSSGGHVILCTQRPSTDVIPAWIKANANGRICFAVPSNTDSIVVIDNGMASKIDRDIPGRGILSIGPKLIEIQSPYITDNQINEIIKQAGSGNTAVEHDSNMVTLRELLEETVDNLGGQLHRDKLFKLFRGRISRDEIGRILDTLNGQPVRVHGMEYRVVRRGRGIHGGTRLERIADNGTGPRLGSFLKGRRATPKADAAESEPDNAAVSIER